MFVDPQTYDQPNEEAVNELVEALRRVGLEARVRTRGPQPVLRIGADDVPVVIERRAVTRATEVPVVGRPPGGVVGVVVSDRISGAARSWLRAHGWGWLDRRGHLRFQWSDRVFVETDIPSSYVPTRKAANPFAPAGLGIVLEMLIAPDEAMSVRDAASRLAVSPGHVSLVLSALREDGLVDRARRPILPALFWALADHWSVDAFALRRLPQSSEIDRELMLTEWVIGGDVAAAQWGAPVMISRGYPPDLYVPSRVVLQGALARFGEATVIEQRAASLRVAPTARVIETAIHRGTDRPMAHPVVVALDLAQDPSRGREILEAWDAPNGYQRVW